jgi:hypothetical protein
MSIGTSLTRRQALLLSGSAAASLASAGLPRWAQAAPSAPALPIPRLIEPRSGEPVTLSLQKTQHRFGAGAAVPARGISSLRQRGQLRGAASGNGRPYPRPIRQGD